MTTFKQHLLAAIDRLERQGTYATFEGVCVYRTDEGHSCIVGQLIIDAEYDTSFEGLTLGEDCGEENINTHPIIVAVQDSLDILLTDSEIDFLTRLQSIHDRAAKEEIPFPQTVTILREATTHALD